MKNMNQYTKNITINWGTPLLGLMTAFFWFNGNITHPVWWLMIIPFVLAGNITK
jgi:hypothetical protein